MQPPILPRPKTRAFQDGAIVPEHLDDHWAGRPMQQRSLLKRLFRWKADGKGREVRRSLSGREKTQCRGKGRGGGVLLLIRIYSREASLPEGRNNSDYRRSSLARHCDVEHRKSGASFRCPLAFAPTPTSPLLRNGTGHFAGRRCSSPRMCCVVNPTRVQIAATIGGIAKGRHGARGSPCRCW